MAKSFILFANTNKNEIDSLLDILKPVCALVADSNGALIGQSVVITGTLSKPREYYKQILENAGAKVVDSVSKKTSFVLAGENAGSKLDKALTLGIKVINEADMDELVNIV